MDADAIRELFEPVGRVQLRRMFGGHGVYLGGLIFAIEANGVLFLKADDVNRPHFEVSGSRPFTYTKLGEQAVLTSYWALPASAFDDVDELRDLTQSALAASERAQQRKSLPRQRKPIAASDLARRAANRQAD